MVSWRPRKTAKVLESIGFFVVDISVVAVWNAFSQSETILIVSQSVSSSSNLRMSLSFATYESIAEWNVNACPGIELVLK